MNYPIGQNLSRNQNTIQKMAIVIRRQKYKNLGLVCTGSSGVVIATAIALQLNPIPPVFYIKRKYERSHHHSMSDLGHKTLVFVDDFISTGTTVKHVKNMLKQFGRNQIQGICMGNFEYPNKHLKDFFIDRLEP